MIHVIDDWYVDTDSLQYISGKAYNRKDGTVELTNRNYHSTLCRALERIGSERKRQKLSKGPIELKEALKISCESDKEFKEYLNRVLKGEPGNANT